MHLYTRILVCGLIFLGIIGCVSCSSFEEKRKTETAVEQAVDKFHDQLNQELYHDIYSQADATMQGQLTEEEFTLRLRSAHEQLGITHNKAMVSIRDSIGRGLRRALGSKRELIKHVDLTGSDVIIGSESFTWAVENDQPKLVSYEMRPICKKPCAIGFAAP